MPEELFVEHCAPALAGVKTANLFTSEAEDRTSLLKQIAEMNQRLRPNGIGVLLLGFTHVQRPLIYVFRYEALKHDLSNQSIQEILRKKGYETSSIGTCLTELIQRLKKFDEFPHEIGCFLGYPAEDIQGFLENQKCKCHGVWKVYGDEEHAKKLFQMYEDCTKCYKDYYAHGATLEFLTVKS